MQTEALIEGMNALDYQVVNLSLRELQHGYDTLQQRQKKARFEFISSNVVWQDTGAPIVAPTAIRKVALRDGARTREVRLGFLGLTRNDPAFTKEGPGGRRIVTVDPIAAAEKLLPALRQKADVVIVLAALELPEVRRLPKQVKDIDLILGGGSAEQTRADDFPEDTQFGKTRVFCVGDQGKFLGEVRLFFTPQKGISTTQRSLIGLTREWPEEPALQKLMEQTKIAVNDFNRAQAEAGNPFNGTPALPAAQPAAPAAAPTPPQATFTGSERCGACHAKEFATWRQSGHARAFEALVKAHQDFNPQCVGCHSIGFSRLGGFVDAKTTPQLRNVGCEDCHGASSRHPEGVAEGYGRAQTSFCVTCHTKENSPDFDPAVYIPKIRHWDEAKTPH